MDKVGKGQASADVSRVQIVLRGVVQGVGFRPFIYRLATTLHLTGWVKNTAAGLCIEVEGHPDNQVAFLCRITTEAPDHAAIQSLEPMQLDPLGYPTFQILDSDSDGLPQTFLPADRATCADCVSELFDPTDRRFRYPFINCTHCGPRYSIIHALPYDRPHTTMRHFDMCVSCRAEYENPENRRFHAQPIACADCGPEVLLWDHAGRTLAQGDQAIQSAIQAIHSGSIVAVKGLGGFHLMVDARSGQAVNRLRERKHRPEKPFALMYPDLEAIEADCQLSPLERKWLMSSEAPVVLVRRRKRDSISNAVAPRNPYLGIMLPFTPLHHLIMAALKYPVIATSGNLTDEPVCIDEQDALQRLGGIADCFLVHNRPIARQVDDSIVRLMAGRETILRRARGHAPYICTLPPHANARASASCLAVGGHLKNTVAVTKGRDIFLSQHIGDLDTLAGSETFAHIISDIQALCAIRPEQVVCDRHPDYRSTQYAKVLNKPVIAVQHHHAHVLSCMADNALDEPALGIVWDGTGYGTDGTIWGGEGLSVTRDACERLACIRPFRLPGGERAIREPRRAAFSLLYEIFGEAIVERTDLPSVRMFDLRERRLMVDLLQKDLNAPWTTSAGRLFDAVASILDVQHMTSFEGQAAMLLEFAIGNQTAEPYPIPLINRLNSEPNLKMLDWEPMVRAMVADLENGEPVSLMAKRFHDGLITGITAVADLAAIPAVVLTGGCFQNVYLCEQTIQALRHRGFRPYWHHRVPPNDGGLALGQAAWGMRTETISGERISGG